MTDTTPDVETDEPKAKTPEIPVFATRPPKTKTPRYMVVDGVFYAQTDDGEVAIKLKFKAALVRSLKGGSTSDQVYELLADRPEIIEQFEELDFAEMAALCDRLLLAYVEKQGALLGEFSGSSI